jgi:hypothetical protein
MARDRSIGIKKVAIAGGLSKHFPCQSEALTGNQHPNEQFEHNVAPGMNA